MDSRSLESYPIDLAEDNKTKEFLIVFVLLPLLLLLLQQKFDEVKGMQQESKFPTKAILPYLSFIFYFISILIP